MRNISIILKILALVVLAFWLRYLAFDYIPMAPGFNPPVYAYLGHALNLIIHEAGHFFFRIFGTTLCIMGGSIFQVIFPLGIGVYVWFRWRDHTIYPLFWTGWNLIDVAVYIYDAPFLLLPLLGGNKNAHDWRYLMTHFHALDSSVPLALTVHWAGVFTCLAALVWGIVLAIRSYRKREPEYSLMETRDPFDPSYDEPFEERYS